MKASKSYYGKMNDKSILSTGSEKLEKIPSQSNLERKLLNTMILKAPEVKNFQRETTNDVNIKKYLKKTSNISRFPSNIIQVSPNISVNQAYFAPKDNYLSLGNLPPVKKFKKYPGKFSHKTQMLSSNMPNIDDIDVQMIIDSNLKNPEYLTKDLERVIDDLKKTKKNDSDLLSHLNLFTLDKNKKLIHEKSNAMFNITSATNKTNPSRKITKGVTNGTMSYMINSKATSDKRKPS